MLMHLIQRLGLTSRVASRMQRTKGLLERKIYRYDTLKGDPIITIEPHSALEKDPILEPYYTLMALWLWAAAEKAFESLSRCCPIR